MPFTKEQEDRIRNIWEELINDSKELNQLLDMLKKRRRYTKLEGHSKVSGERLCQCGSILEPSDGKKSGGWLCPKEEIEWDFIFIKLKGGK